MTYEAEISLKRQDVPMNVQTTSKPRMSAIKLAQDYHTLLVGLHSWHHVKQNGLFIVRLGQQSDLRPKCMTWSVLNIVFGGLDKAMMRLHPAGLSEGKG